MESAGKINMNAVPEVNPLRINPRANDFSYGWPKSCARLTVKRVLLVYALSVVAAYHGKANPTSGAATLADTVLKTDQARARVSLEKGAHKLNLDSHGVILKGYDPVAYFTKKKAVKGTPNYETNYQGAIYYFSSAANLATFKRNPSKYAPQYGGFCANGMKDRRVVDIDPTVFFIIKGKLYVCASPEAEKEFRSNEHRNTKKADQNWDEEYRWWY
jgi:YHS domain-containing protein